MKRYFKPGHSAVWKGICEVFEDGTFIHHSQWPERTPTSPRPFMKGGPLDSHILSGHWVEVSLSPEVDGL